MSNAPGQFGRIDRDLELTSLSPEQVLDKLNLSAPALSAVRIAAESGDQMGVFAALLAHYRQKFPLAAEADGGATSLEAADKICRHVFQWGPYEEVDYGADMDWAWDPRGDIEWVAAMYRFYWAEALASAYEQTREEKYAAAFVELTTDWIRKHVLEDYKRVHSVYTHWRGFVWLDIQTGIRATNICLAFTKLVHARAVTPEFLRLLLGTLYDHQVKTKALPMGQVHNKAVFEQRGFINIAYHFSEFAESRAWMELAMERTRENFLLQTTCDGVQREWSYGYHQGVLRDAVEIRSRMDEMGVAVPEDYAERIRLMYDYIFWVATPDLGAPMFGDGSRPPPESPDRATWPLHDTLVEASELLDDPKYRARARLDRSLLPEKKSHAFTDAGMYVLRDDWGADQIHLALHCSPLGISSHDQPDNGTFELYAHGRWLMPDSGFYTYGHDPEGRAWHRRTRVHQTLTLDGRDSGIGGRHLLWHSSENLDCVVVENVSYEGLIHRRTIWFVDHQFFVLLDEAIGDALGELALHFQFAPGEVEFDPCARQAHTQFPDANILVASVGDVNCGLHEEEGWFAWAYGHRTPRMACRFVHAESAPASFLSIVLPYRGTDVPDVTATMPSEPVSSASVALTVTASGKTWQIGRDLATQSAWCRSE
ncbi:MAG: alginate lyase family protein [Lentisphaeria bacterium]|nr:alginate lyase family protein [Lentisphaeria bacterium]